MPHLGQNSGGPKGPVCPLACLSILSRLVDHFAFAGDERPVSPDPFAWRSALEGVVAGSDSSRKYRLALGLVAVAMVLLPMVYLAAIVLAGWGLWWHATTNFHAYQGSSVRFSLIYVAPLVIGGIGFVFMFKPLLARRPEEEATVRLEAEEQPALLEFIQRLSTCVQARAPTRIDAHIDPATTGVGFGQRFISLMRGDMTLMVSLSMAEAMTLRELAGMLAHELGHCRQGAAIRAWYVITRINHWFASAVFVPDRWDLWLSTAKHSRSSLVQALAAVAQLFVFLTRLLLFLLAVLGLAISSFLSRQMELDADEYQTRVSGSDSLAPAFLKAHTLVQAWNRVQENLQSAWLDGRLADDLPALIALEAAELSESPEAMREMESALWKARTGVLDTHPAPAERLAHAQRLASPGLPLSDSPAIELFRDFRSVCRGATKAFYQQVLGGQFDKMQLIDAQTIVRERKERLAADRTLYRYFQGQLLGHVELFLPEGWFSPPTDAEQTIRALRQSRQAMHAALPKVTAALQQFEQAEKVRCQAFQAQLLSAARIHFRPADFGLEGGDVVAIGRAQQTGWEARQQALANLQDFMHQAETRLTTALCLLSVGSVAAKLDDPEAVDRISRLNDVLHELRQAWCHVQPLREHLFGLVMLMQLAEDHRRNEAYWVELKRVSAVVHEVLGKLLAALAATPYPFEHASGEITVATYLLERLPAADQVGDLSIAGEEALTKLLALYFRAMAQLAVTAERVEAALGLPRMPDPPGQVTG